MKFSWDDPNKPDALPRLVLTGSAPTSTSFSQSIIHNFKDEGYDVTYLPFTGDPKAFRTRLAHLADPLELGEKYAIVGQLFSLAFRPPPHHTLAPFSSPSIPRQTPKPRPRTRARPLQNLATSPKHHKTNDPHPSPSIRPRRIPNSRNLHQTRTQALRPSRLLPPFPPARLRRLPAQRAGARASSRQVRVGAEMGIVHVSARDGRFRRGRDGSV